MKKPISLPTSLPLRLWAVFHALILLAFLISLAAGRGIRADADLMHLMPSAGSGIPARVDESLSQTSSRNVFILARSADFAGARQLAVRLYDRLSREKRFFDSLSLFPERKGGKEEKETEKSRAGKKTERKEKRGKR